MLIYIIKNTINDKVYIGQTTKTLKERIAMYKNEVKWAKKSRPIIDAMKKYEIENFYWEILEDDISTVKELNQKEKQYIEKYHSLCTQNGYNVELGGNNEGKHSEETKQKMSESQVGIKNHMYGKKGDLNITSKKVIELTTGIIYNSASLAAEKLGINFSHVCACARGRRGSTGRYIFRYLDENNNPILIPHRAHCKFKETVEMVLPELKKYI